MFSADGAEARGAALYRRIAPPTSKEKRLMHAYFARARRARQGAVKDVADKDEPRQALAGRRSAIDDGRCADISGKSCADDYISMRADDAGAHASRQFPLT